MDIEYYELELNDYIVKALRSGLVKEDIAWLKKYIKDLDTRISSIASKIEDLESEVRYVGIDAMENRSFFPRKNVRQTLEKWKEEIRHSHELQFRMWELVYGFENATMKRSKTSFVIQNSSLVHLTYTNNQSFPLKPHSTDSYLLLCQFHVEKIPSMTVCSSSNSYYCYGCGNSGNSLTYLMAQEGLTRKEAVRLLQEIYLIDKKAGEESPLALKYRETLLSEEYRSLLERGRKRTMGKEDTYRKRYALIRYQEHLDTIDRVKEKKTIFHRDNLPKQKVYRLPNPEE